MSIYNNPEEPKKGFNKELLNDLTTFMQSTLARAWEFKTGKLPSYSPAEEAKKLYNFLESIKQSQPNGASL